MTLKIKVLIFEITYTLKFLIVKLGLGMFLHSLLRNKRGLLTNHHQTGCLIPLLTPLLLALSGLLRALDKVVAGVLILVGGLLHAILGGLAGGLLGLIGF